MAENRGAIRVVIEAVDKVTAPIRRIGAGIRGILRGLDLDKVKDQIGRVTRGMADVGRAAADMAKRGLAAGTALAASMLAITRSTANATAEQVRAARAAGVSLQSYQQLGHAAGLVGSNADEMGAALTSLQGKALEAARGNWELRRAFRMMGVQIRDARGQMRPTADIMNDVADAFARVPDSARRTEAAMILLGDAGLGILPVLSQGAAGIRRAAEDARRLGRVMTNVERDGLAGFNTGFFRLGQAIAGVRDAIAVRLAPVLTPLLNSFADWIASNRELIAFKIEEWVTGFVRALEAFDWPGFRRDLRDIITTCIEFIDQIGGWKAVLIGVAGVFTGPLVLAIGTFAVTLTTILLPPLLRVVAVLGRILLFRVPAAVAGLLGGGGAAAAGAAGAAGTAGAAAAAAPAAAGAAAAGAGAAAGGTSIGGLAATLGAALLPLAAVLGLGLAEDAERRADTRANGGSRWNGRGQNSGPGGETANEMQRRLDAEDAAAGTAPGAPPAGPPVRPISALPQRLDTGGTITIRLLQDGQAQVVEARPNDRRVRFDATAGTGQYMGGPA